MLVLSASVALACGGFFCSNDPIEQSAERILFVKDSAAGEVEAHVQIFYEGDAEDFAWVVPVPSVPQLSLSSDELFQGLADDLQPTFRIDYEEHEWCEEPDPVDDSGYGYYSYGGTGYGGTYTGSSTYSTIDVIDTKQVGAFETVTLQAQTSEGLVDWLVANDFDIPPEMTKVLAPYVAGQSYFVAMRLASGSSSGSIQPIAMRYASAGMSVPIQLTSIAATPDMRLEVYVLGEDRVVPESYLHVQINDAAVNWFEGGTNYEEVVSRAANEAGGHAFATDHSGPAFLPDAWKYEPGLYNTDRIASKTTPAGAVDEVQRQFVATAQLQAILEEFVPPPPGVDPQNFYNAIGYYDLPADYEWDGVGLAAALEERIVQPLLHIGELFGQHSHLTRLTSSMDAAEMTVDPTFVSNGDMEQEVSSEHVAVVRMLCGKGGLWDDAMRELVLADGRVVGLPSISTLQSLGLSEYEYMGPLTDTAALIIERTSGSGPPVALSDLTTQAETEFEDFPTPTDATTTTPDGNPAASSDDTSKGCGCDQGGSFALWGLLPLGLMVRRRRSP